MNNIAIGLRDISCMLQTQPWQLGIRTASKGLIVGPLQILLSCGKTIEFTSSYQRGILLPNIIDHIKDISSTAFFALVVEKETVFTKLISDNITDFFDNRCIMLSGKGYPDINIRYLLSKMWSHLRIPIYILCDADPHGLQIMLTYRFGSTTMCCSGSYLTVPTCYWIGIKPSEITKLGLATRTLSNKDAHLLRRILLRPYVDETIRLEIQYMLVIGRKAEIESLESISKGFLLNNYLKKIFQRFL